MKRNRKSESAALRFGPALKAVLLCLLLGGSGVGYVWQKDQIVRLGKQMKANEIHLQALLDQNEKLRRQLQTLRNPKNLEGRIRELNLGLVAPQPGQIWSLHEPLTDSPPVEHQTEYAAKSQ